jgi:uncharacterized protein
MTVTPTPALPTSPENSGLLVNRLLFFGLIAFTILFFPPLATRQAWHETFSTYFIAIVLEAVPYILIGSLIAGIIELFMPASLLPRLTKKLGLLGIPATAVVAPAFPACECGVLAVARGLMRKGLPLPHTITYLLAGPILNPTVLFTTWLAFQDARYPILRGIGGLFVAITVGFIIYRISAKRILLPSVEASLQRQQEQADCDAGCNTPASLNLGAALKNSAVIPKSISLPVAPTPAVSPVIVLGKAKPRRSIAATLGQLSSHVIDHFLEMAAFFLLGVFIAAAMKTYFGNAVFDSLAANIILAPLAMMATAFILSLCAEADAFVAASFTQFSIAAQMAFLVFGPMFDIKLFLMYRLVFRTSFIIAIALALTILTLIYVLVAVPFLDQLLLSFGIGRAALGPAA